MATIDRNDSKRGRVDIEDMDILDDEEYDNHFIRIWKTVDGSYNGCLVYDNTERDDWGEVDTREEIIKQLKMFAIDEDCNRVLHTRRPQDWDGEVVLSREDAEQFMRRNPGDDYSVKPTLREVNAEICPKCGSWVWEGTACACS